MFSLSIVSLLLLTLSVSSIPIQNSDISKNTESSGNLLPILLVHGIGADALDMTDVKNYLNDKGFDVYVPNIGNGAVTSLLTPMTHQTFLLCKYIDDTPELWKGFNAIGMSQGGLLLRAVLETCGYGLFNNLITWVSPHGGVYYSDIDDSTFYDLKVQYTLSFTNYWRNPLNSSFNSDNSDDSSYNKYIQNSIFLPWINNEKWSVLSSYYADSITTLNNFVMIWSPNDEVVIPPQSAKFSTLNSDLEVIDLVDCSWYEDLQLNYLDENFRLHIFETNCSHVEHRDPSCFHYLEKYTLPFLY